VDPDVDDEDDDSYNPDDDSDGDSDNESTQNSDVDDIPIKGVDMDENEDIGNAKEELDANMDHNEAVNKNANMDAELAENEAELEAELNENEEDDKNVLQEDVDGAIDPQELTNAIDEKYGECSGVHNLQTRHPRDYSHLHVTLESTVMTQHSMKKGIKLFGEAGIEAVLKGLKQLHDCKVLELVSTTEMS
jgi:hypothetical protein